MKGIYSQTTFSVWVSFSPAPEQKGLPTENSFKNPGLAAVNFFSFFFRFFFFIFFVFPINI